MIKHFNPLSIEKQAFRKKPFAIVDGNGVFIASFATVYDASVCLRFIVGKSMSRNECDIATKLLKSLEGEEENEEQ